jgi:GH18 family chitinase
LQYDNSVIFFLADFYRKVTGLRSQGIKVLIGIGGWNDSLGDKYSRLVNSPSSRANFVRTVIEFIEKYNFDGLDLDWEYPKCWQVSLQLGCKIFLCTALSILLPHHIHLTLTLAT